MRFFFLFLDSHFDVDMVFKIISGIFFLSALVFAIVRFVLFIKNNGRLIFDMSKEILKSKSFHKGVKEYVYTSYPVIASIYADLDFATQYIPALNKVPQLEKIIDRFILEFKKRLILFALIFIVYTVLVNWILKLLLLASFIQ